MANRAAYYGDKPEPGVAADDISATAPATWNSGTSTIGVTLGTGATTAAAGNHTHNGLMTGSATAVNNAATFADLAAATTAYNSLLAALRTRGVITGS